MFPICIVDNFFQNPDNVVDFANTLEYNPGNGRWPGVRTDALANVAPMLQSEIGGKIVRLFYPEQDFRFAAEIMFQKVQPMHEDQYHIKNRGWIHRDENQAFGGIIYLTKDPEPNTGTSIFESKTFSEFNVTHANHAVQKRFYTGEDVSDEEYEENFYSTPDKWRETVKVENVYNRMFMFSSRYAHAVQTFGTKERLTLAFFFKDICSPSFAPPELR